MAFITATLSTKSPKVESTFNQIICLDREHLPTIFEAIAARKLFFRNKVEKALSQSANPGPPYVQKALLDLIDGSVDDQFPQGLWQDTAQAIAYSTCMEDIKWNEEISAYEGRIDSASLNSTNSFLAGILNGMVERAKVFIGVPTTPDRLIEKLTLNESSLDQNDIDRLKPIFFSNLGPWWYCEPKLDISKDEKERISIKDHIRGNLFYIFKQQSRSEFLEEHRECLLKLKPEERDAVIIAITKDEIWKGKGEITNITVDPETFRVDFHRFTGGVKSIYQEQAISEFFERMDLAKINIRNSDVSWFIEYISENEGPWNKRGLVVEIEETEDGSIGIYDKDGLIAKIFPPSSPDEFLTAHAEEISKLDKDTQDYLPRKLDRESPSWCRRGYVVKIEGSINTGLYLTGATGLRHAVFRAQTIEEYLEKYIKSNPLLTKRAKDAVAEEVRLNPDGPWAHQGFTLDHIESRHLVEIKLADGSSYFVKISE